MVITRLFYSDKRNDILFNDSKTADVNVQAVKGTSNVTERSIREVT